MTAGTLDDLLAAARSRARALHPSPPATPSTRASFAAALRGRDRLAVIAEFKRASPTEGGIAPHADIMTQVRRYAAAGAAAISVLTEPTRFGGGIDDLTAAAEAVDLPLLLKDFVVDPRQVAQACAHGASACLLIVRCLEPSRLHELVHACRDLALTPVIECHSAAELEMAVTATRDVPDAVIGINNRDLDNLRVDVSRAPALLRHVPTSRVAVAESGYATPAATATVRGRADAVLIGTGLMRAPDPAAFIAEVRR
ncbi:MAG: indole-3-glycerol-phosphate synthase [Planctomycetota bacterium]